MKLNTKIRFIRGKQALKLTVLHARIKKIFGSKAITYRSLQRIEAGEVIPKEATLYQISMGLGITRHELEKNIQKSGWLDQSRPQKPNFEKRYIYNNKTWADILVSDNKHFTSLKLFIRPGGKTKKEHGIKGNRCWKWIYVLVGKITCVIGDKKYLLNKGDSINVNCRLGHYLENSSPRKACCLVIQQARELI